MLGFSDAELRLALWTGATAAVWLIAVGLVYLVRRPPEPPAGPKTLDVGPDLSSSAEVSGPILRLRAFGDQRQRRHYLAVDDGTSDKIRALRVSAERYAGLSQGEVITAGVTKNLRHVKSLTKGKPA